MLARPWARAGGPRSLTPPQSGLTPASRQHGARVRRPRDRVKNTADGSF